MKILNIVKIIVLIVAISFTSCVNSFLVGNKSQKEISYGKLTLIIDKNLSNSTSNRTVICDVSNIVIENYKVTLTSKNGYGTKSLNGVNNLLTIDKIEAGSWDIRVVGEISGKTVAEGVLSDQTLLSDTINEINIILRLNQKISGNVNLSINFPVSSGIDYLQAGFDGETLESLTLDLSSDPNYYKATFIKSNVVSGMKSLVLIFKKGGESGIIYGIYREIVNVFDYQTSNKWIKGDELSPVLLFGNEDFASNNTMLANLTISSGGLSPIFSSAIFLYSAEVSYYQNEITITPTISMSGQSIKVRINYGLYQTVSSGTMSNALSLNNGDNTIEIEVTSQDGETKGKYTITVKKLSIPSVPLLTGVTNRNVYGANKKFYLFSNNSSKIYYTITSKAGSEPLIPDEPSSSNGNLFTDGVDLIANTGETKYYKIKAIAYNNKDDVGEASGVWSIIIDKESPLTPKLGEVSSGVTYDVDKKAVITSVGADYIYYTITSKTGGTASEPVDPTTDNGFSYSNPADLTCDAKQIKNYRIKAIAYDLVNNKSIISDEWSITIDKRQQLVSLSGYPPFYSNSKSADFTVTGTDILSYKYKLDGGVYGAETDIASTISLSDLTEGEHTVFVIGKDKFDNWQEEANPTKYTWRIDITPPAVTYVKNGNLTPARIQETVVNIDESVNLLQYQWTNSNLFPTSGTWAPFKSGDNLSKDVVTGDYYLHIKTVDIYGNTKEATTNKFIIDNTKPESPTISGINSGSFNTNQTFAITGSEAGGQLQYSYNGTNWNNYTAAVTLAIENTYEVRARQIDDAGNVSLSTSIITVTIEKTPPAIGSVINFTNIEKNSVTVNWGAGSDNSTTQENLKYKLVKSTSSTAIDTIAEVEVITGSDLVMDWTANTIIKNVTGLTSGTTYYFAVLVKDEVGNINIYPPQSTMTQYDIEDGLIGKWYFDGNTNDTSGNNRNGTINGASLSTDRFMNSNKAYSFDGVDDRIDIPNLNADSFQNDFALCVWAKFDDFTNNYGRIMSGYDSYITLLINGPSYGATHRQVGLYTYNRTLNQMAHHIDGNGFTLVGNKWYYIVLIKNSTGAKLYIDGNLVNSVDSPSIALTGSGFSFGNNPPNYTTSETLNGKLDDIRIYSRPISESEVLQLYLEGGYVPTVFNQTDMVLVPQITNFPMGYVGVAEPVHTVPLISEFYMGKYEVTYDLWYSVKTWANSNGYTFANAGREGNDGTDGAAPTSALYEPVTYINWRDCIVWCNAYSQKMGLTPVYYTDAGFTTPLKISTNTASVNTTLGSEDNPFVNWNANGYRLPTEAEWEAAARYKDGSNWTQGDYASGATANCADLSATGLVAWFNNNSGSKSHDVSTKNSNQLLLNDMSGNVWEWCWDWFSSYTLINPYTNLNPKNSNIYNYRIARGGCWGNNTDNLLSSKRGYNDPFKWNENTIGLRLARKSDSVTYDITSPTIGSAINFTNTASTSVTVNWGAGTDNSTMQENLKYKLVKSTSSTAIDTIAEVDAITGADLVMDWTANMLTKNVTGLTSNTIYYFAVIVMDESGNKGIYNPESVTTLSAYIPYTEMVLVEGGAFIMGWSELTSITHNVPFISSFNLGKFEVTYELWYSVKQWALSNGYSFANLGREGHDGTDGAIPTTAKYEPVTNINWRDCIVWCNAYSQKSGLSPVYYTNSGFITPLKTSTNNSSVNTTSGSEDNPYVNWNSNGFRLVTEAEWEYSARRKSNGAIQDGNKPSGYYGGEVYNGASVVSEWGPHAWWDYTVGNNITHNVGLKLVNGVNVHDMSGNVTEWCWDWNGGYNIVNNPKNVDNWNQRIARGGSWGNSYSLQTSNIYYAGSNTIANSIGFRICKKLESVDYNDITPPTVGSAINLTNTASTSVTVGWGAGSDNSTTQTNLRYKLVKSTSSAAIDTIAEADAITGADLVMDWTTNTLTKNVTGLMSNTTYYFAVIVIDESGNKGIYNPAGVTTLYNPVGQLDTSFNGSGSKSLEPNFYGRDMVVDNQNKVLVVGSKYVSGYHYMYIMRLNENGTIDTSFNESGYMLFSTYVATATSVIIDSNNKILISGFCTISNENYSIVWRLNNNGTLDNSFNSIGYKINYSVSSISGLNSIVIDNTDKIILNYLQNTGTGNHLVLFRYNNNGSIDTSFNSNGYIVDTSVSGSSYLSSIIDSSNNIIVAGQFGGGKILRYLSSGLRDTIFGGSGFINTGNDGWTWITYDKNNRIIFSGYYSVTQALIKRYNSNFSLDITFNSNGSLINDLGAAKQIVPDLNNNYIILGIHSINQVIRIERYLNNGTIDSSFNSIGYIQNYSTLNEAKKIRIDNNNKIIFLGMQDGLTIVYKYK